MNCLNNIIGITSSPCECLTENLSESEINELTISESGLYLDELEGGIKFRDVQNLSYCKTLLDAQKEAIETAKKHFKTDLLASLNSRYKMKKNSFVGSIGKPSFSGSLDARKRLQFLEIIPTNSDAVVEINGFRIFLSEDVSTNVFLYELEEGKTEGNRLFDGNFESSNKTIFVPFSGKLPLKKNGFNVRYFLIWERIGTVKPRNIETSCGCSSGDGYTKFISVAGGEVDGFSELANARTDAYTHGFSIEVSVKCEAGNLICNEYDASDAVSLVTSFAILYKAGELVIENILNSGEVNRFTMLTNERLWGKRNHFKKEYNDRINYLSQQIDVSSSDCFICRSENFFIGNIVN